MSSVAQIEANRRNCLKSTGPRTPEGVAACCRNALKHGLLSSQVLLACESREELDEHARALRESLRPEGPVEGLLADRVAAQAWRLRRVMQLETAILDETVGRFDVLGDSRDEGDAGDMERRGDAEKGDAEKEEERDEKGNAQTRREGGTAKSGRVPAAITGRAVRDFLQEGLRGLDVLRRYERAIDQGLYQAMRELSALQSARSADEKTRSRENQEHIEAILNDPRLPGILHQYAIDVKAEAEGKRDAGKGEGRRGDTETRRGRQTSEFRREPVASAGPANQTEPIREEVGRDAGERKDAEKGDAETRRGREEEAESGVRYAEAAA